jgi:uncharacterized protein YggU (UPF0235/DUF167 family)
MTRSRVMPPFRVEGLRVTFQAKIKPRAPRDRMYVDRNGRVRIDLRAVPENYEANDDLVRFLARGLRIPKDAIDIAWGLKITQKLVRITGYPPGYVLDRLMALTSKR